MHLLVFGSSDSDGSNLPDRSLAWPVLLKERAASECGTDLELSFCRLYVHAEGWEDRFEQAIASAEPDIIVVCVNGVSWSFRTVPIRLRKWFGRGAGGWAERQQRRMDEHARSHRVAEKVASGVHWIVRHTVPPGTFLSRSVAEARWLKIIDRVAREEAFAVVVGKTDQHGDLLKTWPKVNDEIASHNRALHRRVNERRLTWFESQSIIDELGRDAAHIGDLIHRREPFHVMMADRLLEIIRPALATRA